MGLWRNCYDRTWLAGRKEWEIEVLQIIDEDYDFTLGDEDHFTPATEAERIAVFQELTSIEEAGPSTQ